MERLTEERGERTYKLYRYSWYVNIGVAIFFLVMAGYVWAADPDGKYTDALGFFALGLICFIGSSMSRYQSRLEGQHVELKVTMNRILRELDDIKAKVQPRP
jgi:hypothetical protein